MQLASEARRRGWRHITLLSRGPLAIRTFDIPEEWVQRHFSRELLPCEAAFFGADTYAERRAMLARARPGGSIPRAAHEQLAATPCVEVHEAAHVARAEWCARDGELVACVRRAQGASGTAGAHTEATTTVRADAAWLATGHHLDAALVPPLATLRACRPRYG